MNSICSFSSSLSEDIHRQTEMSTNIQDSLPHPSSHDGKMDPPESDIESSRGTNGTENGNGAVGSARGANAKKDDLMQVIVEEKSIYRVPEGLRDIEQIKFAFVPKLISIGPFYHNDDKLKAAGMGECKTYYCNELLKAYGRGKKLYFGSEFPGKEDDNVEKQRAMLREDMKGLLEFTKKFYQPMVFTKIKDDEFVEMMMLDGCFIIQLLRKFHEFQQKKTMNAQVTAGDPILNTRWMLRTLQRDMIMLDNQLPYKVLRKIYRRLPTREDTPLHDLVLEFFKPLFPKNTVISNPRPIGEQGFDHMLELFLTCFTSKVSDKVKDKGWSPQEKGRVGEVDNDAEYKTLSHRARNLSQAGIEIKKAKKNSKGKRGLLEIEFDSNGLILSIPQLFIGDDTLTVLLNFLALEQWDHEPNPFFTNYFFFMDCMIHAKEDVELLHEARIINHILGRNKAISELINKVCRQIVNDPERCYLWDEIHQVNTRCNAYYDRDWVKWRSNLKGKYFSNPWSCISLAAAVFLLILTFVQTIYTVYPYYAPGAGN